MCCSTWCNAPGTEPEPKQNLNPIEMSTDVNYDTTPFDGTPRRPWDEFKLRLRNIAARLDERGYSLAETTAHWDGTEHGRGTKVEALEGGPTNAACNAATGPAFPGAAVQHSLQLGHGDSPNACSKGQEATVSSGPAGALRLRIPHRTQIPSTAWVR